MTKVMTLIVMCERLTRDDLKQTVTFTSEMYDYARSGNYIGSTNYGIDPRDEYKVEDLLYGIGMYSASDCVLSVLLYLNVTEEQFVVWMNEKVEQLQLTNTHFDNAIGYESAENYTTAQDMAQIMAYAMQNDLIRSFLSKEAHISAASGYNSKGEYVPTFQISFYSTLFGMHENSRMYSYEKNYGTPFQLQTAKLLAGKTGYLENGGVKNHCLVVYAKDSDSDAHYILVVGGGTQPQYVTMKDIKNILDTYVP
jgi:D-alanyl-D-alanine carboxypeptidase